MGRTAVNFVFDMDDIDINTSSKEVLDRSYAKWRDTTSTRTEYSIFAYETTEYTVPIGKRLIFRVNIDFIRLWQFYNANDDNKLILRNNIFESAGLNVCFPHVKDLYTWDSHIQDINNTITNSADLTPVFSTTPVLIAKSEQKIKILFTSHNYNQNNFPFPFSNGSYNSTLSVGGVCDYLDGGTYYNNYGIKTISFSNPIGLTKLFNLNSDDSSLQNRSLTSTLWRKGFPKVAYLNGFLEDDI